MMRLGTRTPGGATYDLHQGNLRVDERCVGIGARLLAETAVEALATATDGQLTAAYRIGNNFGRRRCGVLRRAFRA